ncbi:hypothetical protein QJU96_08065 [Pasteurella skyensis]|uniref:Pili and flagellar-assembly chaperone, PapD N-terminal domain n=1 Tax=Phocoenobacter skyensis TaxID=97481 RepID=A0AAJ6NDC1_9PAST|nr:hypothetical protein [Pasteurella skyensis]MDP8171239.1 hypothetical protein [Pasteurella skyensis]MDP8174687.1 hypothetical protein [Pasteurella skyensis]
MKLSISKKCILLAVAFTTASFVHSTQIVVKKNGELPPAQLGITPSRIESDVAVSKGERLDKSFVIYNYNSTREKQVRLSLVDVNKKHNVIKPSKKTLLPWTIINPKQFTIPASGQQTVRLSIRPPSNFPKKTHYAMLKIDNHIESPLNIDQKTKSITVTLGASYGLPIIVTTK